MPELTPQVEAELLEGFKARKWTAENELFETLRPFFRRDLRRELPVAITDFETQAGWRAGT